MTFHKKKERKKRKKRKKDSSVCRHQLINLKKMSIILKRMSKQHSQVYIRILPFYVWIESPEYNSVLHYLYYHRCWSMFKEKMVIINVSPECRRWETLDRRKCRWYFITSSNGWSIEVAITISGQGFGKYSLANWEHLEPDLKRSVTNWHQFVPYLSNVLMI